MEPRVRRTTSASLAMLVALAFVLLAVLSRPAHGTKQCPNSTQVCPSGSTCCDNGCCPNSGGVCCEDGQHCCSHGYHCTADRCEAEDRSEHKYMPWMPLYNLCSGPLQTQRLKSVVDNTDFVYFSDNGDIESPERSGVQMVVIVVHGAARNADEYFCSVLKAAELQTQFPRDSVAVYAPWYMEPQDNPPDGVVYWSGVDENGVWRSGQESKPSATSSGATISSYAILDRMLTALNSTRRFPKLRHVTLVGHSSGGQTVQRYALTQHAQGLGHGLARTFRYVVANPSSYCYLDPRRWIDGKLTVPSEAVVENCSSYNMWEWGLDGKFPLYVANGREVNKLVTAYARQRVVYLLGQNDTCNDDLKPGCHSHGLEKTCMDMLEGRFRLERGHNYYRFLREHYQREVHNMSVVPNAGHDHTLIFQSRDGLAAIFEPDELEKTRNMGLKRAANITLAILASCVLLAILVGLHRNLRRNTRLTTAALPSSLEANLHPGSTGSSQYTALASQPRSGYRDHHDGNDDDDDAKLL